MPAPLVAVGTLLLQALPGIVSAVSDLVKSIREKRGAREIASDAAAAVSQLVDVASAAASDLPADSPLREVLALTGQLTEIMADGQATPDELRALGERLVELGAACLAAAQDGPQEATTAAPAPAAEVIAAGASKRRQARMHARPKARDRKPIGSAALAEGLAARLGGAGMPVPPASRPRWLAERDPRGIGDDANPTTVHPPRLPPFAEPTVSDKDSAWRRDHASARPPGEVRPPWADTDDDTADVPPTRPVGGVIGDGRGTTAPPVVEPVVEPPALPTEPVVDEVGEGPPAGDSGGTLTGRLLIARQVHFDGLDRPGADIAGLLAAMKVRAAFLSGMGIPELWSLTASQVEKFEAVEAGALAALPTGPNGVTIAAREPHRGEGTADEARLALLAAGVLPSAVLGSCLDPAQYVGGPWPILCTGAAPGHVGDTSESGFRRIAPGYTAVQSATPNSMAKKQEIARSVKSGALPWGFEVMAIQALSTVDGQAHVGEGGARHFFGTPPMKPTASNPDHGTYASVPAEDAWARMIAECGAAADRVECVGFEESVARADADHVLDATGQAIYTVAKS